MNANITKYESYFLNYAKEFCAREKKHRNMLELKITHSLSVLEHMQRLVQEDSLVPYTRACLLAALFHDVARFEQFARFGTFKDSLSINHGLLGVKILKEQNWLKSEPAIVRSQVYAAISMHNRFSIPSGLPEHIRLITLALRDADKLDILRVMYEHFSNTSGEDAAVSFHAKDEPEAFSENIINAILNNRIASYDDIVYINDFKLLLGSWLHELHFANTKKLLIEHGYLQKILQDVPMHPKVQEAKTYVLKLLNNINVT